MANTLKAWLTDNTVTADPNDKILVLESTGKADLDKVLEEMQAEDTYELAVCTQLNSGRTLLKEPRTVTVPVYVGTPAGDKPEEL